MATIWGTGPERPHGGGLFVLFPFLGCPAGHVGKVVAPWGTEGPSGQGFSMQAQRSPRTWGPRGPRGHFRPVLLM